MCCKACLEFHGDTSASENFFNKATEKKICNIHTLYKLSDAVPKFYDKHMSTWLFCLKISFYLRKKVISRFFLLHNLFFFAIHERFLIIFLFMFKILWQSYFNLFLYTLLLTYIMYLINYNFQTDTLIFCVREKQCHVPFGTTAHVTADSSVFI